MLDDQFRQLNADRLIETAEALAARIGQRFPGLTQVACSVVGVARDAVATAEKIRRPDWPLRLGLIVLAVLIIAGASAAAIVELKDATAPAARVLEFLRATQGAVVYLSAAVFFCWSLEARFKRGRVVAAVHELRALAHIIDMHQLTKDPDRVGDPLGQSIDPGATDGPMSAESVGHYLHYCTELLALISKLGQFYIQGFPDGTALAAVDQFENLATGLSQKIWQKLMILDRLTEAAEDRAGAAALPLPTPTLPTPPAPAPTPPPSA